MTVRISDIFILFILFIYILASLDCRRITKSDQISIHKHCWNEYIINSVTCAKTSTQFDSFPRNAVCDMSRSINKNCTNTRDYECNFNRYRMHECMNDVYNGCCRLIILQVINCFAQSQSRRIHCCFIRSFVVVVVVGASWSHRLICRLRVYLLSLCLLFRRSEFDYRINAWDRCISYAIWTAKKKRSFSAPSA